jgi:hypothetical protein
MAAITAIQITSSPNNSDPDFVRLEVKPSGKINGAFYMWYKKGGEADPITDLRVTYDERAPGDNLVRLPENLTQVTGKQVFVWTSTNPKNGTRACSCPGHLILCGLHRPGHSLGLSVPCVYHVDRFAFAGVEGDHGR